MSVHEKALKGIFDDMDDFESNKMFGDPKTSDSKGGFSVTITMNPDESHISEEKEEGAGGDEGFENLPADHDSGMCKGGCAMHKGGTVPKPLGEADTFSALPGEKEVEYKKGEVGMAKGGMVPDMGETDDIGMPPFLRKKKAPFSR